MPPPRTCSRFFARVAKLPGPFFLLLAAFLRLRSVLRSANKVVRFLLANLIDTMWISSGLVTAADYQWRGIPAPELSATCGALILTTATATY